jgi:TrmH family RNA methyltransferase
MAKGRKRADKGPRFSVVLVEPKFQGNIGAVARAMKNFDVEDLVLARAPPLDEEAYQRAMHSKEILDKARRYKTVSRALSSFDYLVGTTKESTRSDKKHLRKSIPPRELADHLRTETGRIGLLFGREDFGLFNDELERCDIIVTIPASDVYPVLNLSHAVTVVLYELYLHKASIWKPPASSGFERDKMMEMFSAYMGSIEYPEHKRRKASIMLKRVIGRANVSKWEFHTVMGLFHKAIKKIDRLEKGAKGRKAKGRPKARKAKAGRKVSKRRS